MSSFEFIAALMSIIIGLGVTNLSGQAGEQLSLFGDTGQERQERLVE